MILKMNVNELSWLLNEILALENKLLKDQKDIQHQLIEKDKIIDSLKNIQADGALCKNCRISKETRGIQTEDLINLNACISSSDDGLHIPRNCVLSMRRSKRFSRNSCRKFTKPKNANTYSKKLSSPLSSPIANDYDCWYASDSASDCAGVSQDQTKIREADNPVLECVNQIILQQNMDVVMESTAKKKNNNSLQSKHVHFSIKNKEQNVSLTNPLASARKDNEYEQIETLDNYLKMKSQKNPTCTMRKSPPILPPKPANLMKLQQISKERRQIVNNQRRTIDSSESEQDNLYCSIGEVHEASKSIKIVAEIHETANRNKPVELIDDLQISNSVETLSDVPKLPNVAEIISPKSTKIFRENCSFKSPIKHQFLEKNMKPTSNKPRLIPEKELVSTELNIPCVNFSDKNQLEAEFEFFNLDAEYDNKFQPNDSTKFKRLPENSDIFLKKIEYNLDMEFSIS